MSKVQTLKRFNAKVETDELLDKVVFERFHYNLCNGTDHFHCSIPTNGRQGGWADAETIGPCDGSCAFGQKTIYASHLPWAVQELIGYTFSVPNGYILVHQRFAHDNRPYFKIFGSGRMVCPAMADESKLLQSGAKTIVLLRDRKDGLVKVISVTNCSGKPQLEVIAQVEDTSDGGAYVWLWAHGM